MDFVVATEDPQPHRRRWSDVRQALEDSADDGQWRTVDVPEAKAKRIIANAYVTAHRNGMGLRTDTRRLPGERVRLYLLAHRKATTIEQDDA